jgi:hypothetical protein
MVLMAFAWLKPGCLVKVALKRERWYEEASLSAGVAPKHPLRRAGPVRLTA